MKQAHLQRSKSVPANTATDYTNLIGAMEISGGESQVQNYWLVDGTFSNLIVTLNNAPGVGKSWAFTVRKNGSDTSVTCTISDAATTARDTTHSFSVAPGDRLALKWVPTGTPTAPSSTGMTSAIEFDGTTANQSGHAWCPQLLQSTVGRKQGVFASLGASWPTGSADQVQNIVAAAGTIDAIGGNLCSGAPGVPDSISIVLVINGTKQDGIGGTTDTTLTFGSADTLKTKTFTAITVSPGDRINYEVTVMSTFGNRCGMACRFIATTNGQSNFAGTSSNLDNAGTRYLPVAGGHYVWNATEASVAVSAGVTSFTLSGLQIVLQTQPGAAKTWTIDFRRNASSPGPSVAITGTPSPIVGSDTVNSAAITDGDTIDLRAVPTSTPAVGFMAWAMIQRDSVTVTGLPNAMLVSP